MTLDDNMSKCVLANRVCHAANPAQHPLWVLPNTLCGVTQAAVRLNTLAKLLVPDFVSCFISRWAATSRVTDDDVGRLRDCGASGRGCEAKRARRTAARAATTKTQSRASRCQHPPCSSLIPVDFGLIVKVPKFHLSDSPRNNLSDSPRNIFQNLYQNRLDGPIACHVLVQILDF